MEIAGTAELFTGRRPPPGSHPGHFVIPPDAHPTRVRATIYGPDGVEEREVTTADALTAATAAPGVTWIEIVGLGDGSALGWVRDALDVHRLAVADLANVPQRPKFEQFGEHELLIAQEVRVDEDGGIALEQASVVLGPGWVVSVLEQPTDVFEPVRARVHANGSIRRMGPAYLAYALLDAVIDGYFPVVEVIGELLDDLEEEVIEDPRPRVLRRLHAVRRTLAALHRSMWRQRDAFGQVLRGDSLLAQDPVRLFVRDAQDHAMQALDAIEACRELVVALMDVYLSGTSNRLNEVMKTLTIMASIFIPLSFIVGVYGMNFEDMPELHWRWGYPAVWLVIVTVAVSLLAWFRRRGWLGDGGDGES